MNKYISNFQSIILLFCFLLPPFGTLNTDSPKEIVTGKFSPGGMQLEITIRPINLIHALDIWYCDGTEGNFSPIPLILGDFTYFDEKPMQKVRIYTSTSEYTINTYPRKSTIVKRDCGNGEEVDQQKPYCNYVEVSRLIHRSQAEPISFKSNRFIYKAGLKLHGVDGIIWARTISYNYGLRSKQNLEYDYVNQTWSGTFPSMYIPIGKYSDVWLMIQDEFGQTAKCRIGDLEIQY